jgi:hypothetical protein
MNWYLIIPWILGITAWLVARQRVMQRPVRLGLAFFLVGCGIVVLFDLGVL